MRRRTSTGDEPTKARRPKTAALKRRNGLKPLRRPRSSATGQETGFAQLTRELNDAREQQSALAEVLGAISRSRFELQPILESVVQNSVMQNRQ